MNATSRHGIVAVLLILSAACGDSPTSPPESSQPPVVPAPPPPPPAPPPLSTENARIFVFVSEMSYPVRSYTQTSRYILYGSGDFALQYSDGVYSGRYTEANGIIDFSWNGWSIAGPWGATGTLKDRELTVRYNIIMAMSDFEDAVYMLVE